MSTCLHLKEFRDDVVAVAGKGEAPIAHLAVDFGICECLRNWMRQADVEVGVRPGPIGGENAELKDARRKIRLLEQWGPPLAGENEVLRRAAAYLSQANLRLGQSPK